MTDYSSNCWSRSIIHTCESSGRSIFLLIFRVPSVPPVNFQNLRPVKKIKYNKILTYILRSIFLEIPHLELPHWRKMLRDTNAKGECHTVNREILVMVLFWPLLAPIYKVPKLNTPKYVTLQKLTAKIEHCLNIFLYLYSLVCTFLSYFFPK